MDNITVLPAGHKHTANLVHVPRGSEPKQLSSASLDAFDPVDIVAVGAVYETAGFHKGLSRRDKAWFRATIEFCMDYGILSSARKFNVKLPNYLQGADILDPVTAEQCSAKIYMVNYVVNPLSKEGQAIQDNPTHSEHKITSPLHTDMTSWRKSADNCGADVIVLFNGGEDEKGDGREICSSQFTDIKSEFVLVARKGVLAPRSTHGLVVDQEPNYAMEVLVRRSYLDKIIEANPRHPFAQFHQPASLAAPRQAA